MIFMNGTEERVLEVLDNLLEFDEIYACMVVRKNMEGIIPPTERFEQSVIDIWEILHETMNDFFDIIERYSKYKLGEIYFSMMDYEVLFFVLPDTDTALVAIIPALANRGLLEVAMEKARRDIISILGEEQNA